MSDVGYKKPPKQSRFVKGQSGNPEGRPKRRIDLDRIEDQPTLAAILREAGTTITVGEGETRKSMSKRDALAASVWASAIKGNPSSQRLLSEELFRAEVLEAARIAQQCSAWALYIENCDRLDDDAAAKNEPAPTHFPHPGDIIIQDGKPVRFRFPMSWETVTLLEELAHIRDALLYQHVNRP